MAVTSVHRQLFDIELEPVAGSRFQPTNFPDLGPAEFKRPLRRDGQVEWIDALLVESAQSMANRLEDIGWDKASQRPVPILGGLPYVRVVARDDGRFLTSSRLAAHRLASAWIRDSELNGRKMHEVIKEKLGLRDDTPLAPREIAAAVFALDPLCLLHGVFFTAKPGSIWPGQPRIPRAVTGFIEATKVRAVYSGGAKRDEVRHKQVEREDSEGGLGSIIYHRTEYVASEIVASLAVDLEQIRSYGLEDVSTELLTTLARWEIRSLLDGGLRLRTACDLAPVSSEIVDRDGAPLPPLTELESQVRDGVAGCRGVLGDGEPITVIWGGGQKRGRGRQGQEEEEPAEG